MLKKSIITFFNGTNSFPPDVVSFKFESADGKNYFRVDIHDLIELSKLPKLKALAINFTYPDEEWKESDVTFDNVESLHLQYDAGFTSDAICLSISDVKDIIIKFPKLRQLLFDGNFMVDPLVIRKYPKVQWSIPYLQHDLLLIPAHHDADGIGILVGSVAGGNVWSVEESDSEIDRILRKFPGARKITKKKAIALFEKNPHFRAFPSNCK